MLLNSQSHFSHFADKISHQPFGTWTHIHPATQRLRKMAPSRLVFCLAGTRCQAPAETDASRASQNKQPADRQPHRSRGNACRTRGVK